MSSPASHIQISQLLDNAIQQLSPLSDSARLDAELLLCYILKKDRSFLRTWPEHQLSDEETKKFNRFLQRRLSGEPIAHIIGERGFWSLNLNVTPDTLIPRPDTERLVELALERIPTDANWSILDLGTGTGAIALSLAKERPRCNVIATDKSAAALEIAKDNALKNDISNARFIQSDWFAALDAQAGKFDVIVSNPPYIKENDLHLKQGDVRFEPLTALASGADGLDDIRIIIQRSKDYLAENGVLLIEHGYDQARAVCALLNAADFTQVADYKDDNGNPRVAVGYYH